MHKKVRTKNILLTSLKVFLRVKFLRMALNLNFCAKINFDQAMQSWLVWKKSRVLIRYLRFVAWDSEVEIKSCANNLSLTFVQWRASLKSNRIICGNYNVFKHWNNEGLYIMKLHFMRNFIQEIKYILTLHQNKSKLNDIHF